VKRPVFQKPEADDFFPKMHREVQENILGDDSIRDFGIAKALLLLSCYFTFYACILAFGNSTPLLFLFYILTGISMILVFINSFHDAVHGALFRTPRYNEWFAFLLEFFGSNSWLWQKRHMSLHHAYPNIQDWDIDIKQSDVVRIFPNSTFFNYHRYQHLYMWFIYPMYSLNWLFIRDFRDFFGSKDNYVKRIYTIPPVEYVRMILAKSFNLFYMIGIPIILLEQPWYIIVAGWFSMHLVGSSLGVIALISTHADESAEFPTVPEHGLMPTTWVMHQLRVTKDFSPDSKIANFLFGGFTHHVAHHLFPGVAHTYYPAITRVIKRYADDYDLPYTAYPFHYAVASHFRMLKRNGHENLFLTGEL